MKTKIDTSISIDQHILNRLEKYSKSLGLSKQDIIIKSLAHFIKRSRSGVFMKSKTVGYQVKSGSYKKLTLHLSPRELEIFKQIRVVTLLSTSYVFAIAMDLFGYKLFKKAKKSKWILTTILSYTIWGSYPEYELLAKKTLALSRYRLSYY
jgi:hypothetical protein